MKSTTYAGLGLVIALVFLVTYFSWNIYTSLYQIIGILILAIAFMIPEYIERFKQKHH